MNNALQRFAQEEHRSHIGEIFRGAEKDVPREDFKEKVARLENILYNKDDYYVNKESSIKQSMDTYVANAFVIADSISARSPSDISILLKCFELLKPTEPAQETPGTNVAQQA